MALGLTEDFQLLTGSATRQASHQPCPLLKRCELLAYIDGGGMELSGD